MKQHYTVVHTGDASKKLKRDALSSLALLSDNLKQGKNSIIFGNRLYNLGCLDAFRFLVEGLDDCPLAYRNLILNSAHTIHRNCAVTVPLYLAALQYFLGCVNPPELEQIEADLLKLLITKKRIASTSAKRQWKKAVYDNQILENFDFLSEALDVAGALGTIEIKQDKYFCLEVYDGVQISAHLSPVFAARISPLIELSDCKIVVVDGIIKDVSSLNRLLVYASESKTNVALFATGFSDDVLNTLIQNWIQGRLSALPMVFNNDLNDVNQLYDFSKIIGSTPVTKDNGLTLSTISEEDIPSIKKISVNNFKRTCDLTCDEQTLTRVFNLRVELQAKKLEENIQDIQNIISTRLAKLASRKVVIKVPCDPEELGILQDRIASLLTFVKCCAIQQVITTEDLNSFLKLDLPPQYPQILPAGAVKLSIRRAFSDYHHISKIGALILTD